MLDSKLIIAVALSRFSLSEFEMLETIRGRSHLLDLIPRIHCQMGWEAWITIRVPQNSSSIFETGSLRSSQQAFRDMIGELSCLIVIPFLRLVNWSGLLEIEVYAVPSSNFECHGEKSQKVRLGVCEVTTSWAEVVIGIEIGPRGARFVSEKSREIQSLEGTRGREGPKVESRICVACHPRSSFVSVPRDTIAIFHIGTR